jgi:hypothetical protein
MDTEFAKTEEVALDLDQLLADLDTPGKFPEDAIRMCQRHRDVVTPRLIDVMRRAAGLCRQGEQPDGNAHLFALYLVWEFEAAEAGLPFVS